MEFDVSQLVQAIRQQPGLRDELLRALLSDRFLDVPERLDALEQALLQLTQRVDQLTQRMDQLTQRVDQLTQRVDGLAERIDELAQAQHRTEVALQRLTDRFDRQLPRIDTAVGYVIERRYHDKAAAYFSTIAKRLRVVPPEALEDLLEPALDEGTLSEQDAQQIRLADTIAVGKRDGETVYLVVEASYTVDKSDVQRAVIRASLLSNLVERTIPVVAAEYIDEYAERQAQQDGVWQVLDATATPPQAAA